MQTAWNATTPRGKRLVGMLATLVIITGGAGCDMGQFTVKTTAKVLRRAQPAMKMEADYEMAARAMPAALKTVESFWVVRPQDDNLRYILTEGYCQYGTAFVEDEWERAVFAKDLEAAEYHNARAVKMFTRCMNYALMQLGDNWQKNIFSDDGAVIDKLVAGTGTGKRTALMWAAVAFGSIINHNLNSIEIISHLDTVKKMLDRVVYLDAHGGKPDDKALQALPHIALGMLAAGKPVAMGGQPDVAKQEFQAALALTAAPDGTDLYLMPRVLMAYKVGRQTHDRELFHKELVKVLETPPSVWPAQRLANEVAHRRARRYLGMEKEIFE